METETLNRDRKLGCGRAGTDRIDGMGRAVREGARKKCGGLLQHGRGGVGPEVWRVRGAEFERVRARGDQGRAESDGRDGLRRMEEGERKRSGGGQRAGRTRRNAPSSG